ncbi:MAG TPA: bifunctional riboflavin kinase/FAD synthetase [Desulfomicrobiaceae bacterium]|nr:bifunctional riboflavin kinase/FAD synthetase [Desulfomicrobiaceae bacterium]
MQLVKTIDDISQKLPGSCVTIGNFDGVHKGHQALLSRVRESAEELGLPSVVMTFDPHPLRIFSKAKNPPFITLLDQKLELMEAMGVDYVFCVEFTRELAALDPGEFVRTYLVRALNVRQLVIGYDYAFGKGRQGGYELLRELGRQHGFTVEQLAPVIVGDDIVSSTRIREMVEAGNVWEARPLLGRFYRVAGQVVRGLNRGGRLLGFPTANLQLIDELFPKPGVYAVWAELETGIFPAVANIGFNPTFGNEVLSVEVHLLEYAGDLYDKPLRVHFVQRLRSEKKFSGLEELKEQISRDIALGKAILSSEEARLS